MTPQSWTRGSRCSIRVSRKQAVVRILGGVATLRPYVPADRPDVYEVCVRTGAGGKDARGQFSNDDLLPDIYAGPYVSFAPEFAWVVVQESQVLGYLVGVPDTALFVDWHTRTWMPELAAKYWSSQLSPAEHELVMAGLAPEQMLIAELADFPAHLHINLLPELQGLGFGRRLIEEFASALRGRGVPGVHLGVDPANEAALSFYQRLGFLPLPSGSADLPILGRRIGADS